MPGSIDIAVVRTHCHGNGCGGCDAPVVAANRGHADTVKAQYGPKDCASTECADPAPECPEVELTCAGGCKIVEADAAEGEGDAPAEEAAGDAE